MNFKCLLKASLLIIVPVSFYSFLVALLENNQNQIITSLFLSLIYGSIYVIILYIVVSRLIIKQEKSANALQKSEKKKVIALIYEGRYAVRLVIILYVFVRGCRILMLGGYSAAAIAIPVLLGGILLGCGGIRGLVSFYQSIFWWVVSFLTVVTVGGISKVYPGRWGSLLEWHLEKPILRGICEIMKSGYIFLAAFAMIEFVVYLYTMVERRKRLMLGTAIALPVIISVMGSLFVIGILGIESLSQGKKGILNIVGALKLPFTEISHLGILVSGLFVIFGISAIGVHFVFAGEAMEHAGGKTPGKLFIYGLLVFVLLLIADRWLLTSAFPYLAAGYICMVDLPLSVILPGFLVRKKAGIWKMAAEVVGILGMVFLFTGCSRPAIEDVDYLTMVIVNVRESTPLYTFVVDSISDNADQETVEEIFESTAAGFEQSILEYNNSHAKTLDISHTEYIVVPDEDTFKIISEEMNEAYPTAYVEIIYQENIIDQAGDNGIRKFTESHYKGKSLAETE